MNRRLLCALAALALGLWACSCATTAKRTVKPANAGGVPAWINGADPDVDPDYYYAVGVSGATYHPEDGIRNAGMDARVKLGHTMASEVLGELRTTARVDEGVEKVIVEKMVYTFSNTSLYGVEVERHWIDSDGLTGPRGTVYARARMPRSQYATLKQDVVKQHGP